MNLFEQLGEMFKPNQVKIFYSNIEIMKQNIVKERRNYMEFEDKQSLKQYRKLMDKFKILQELTNSMN
jgi:uncharacterized membrane protein YgaE (UPF0421/DUF939 family)